MPHEATVDHTDVLNDNVEIGAHMRAKESRSKGVLSSESRKQITYTTPVTSEKHTHNFDDDADSSDEGSDQLVVIDNKHKINGAF